MLAGRYVEGKPLPTSWAWWQLQKKDCLKSVFVGGFSESSLFIPELKASLTAERPQCLRQVRPGSGTESGVKKIFCIFSDYKNSISVEKKWKFHTSTREKEKHKLYTTSTHSYYNYFGVYSSSPYIYYYIYMIMLKIIIYYIIYNYNM